MAQNIGFILQTIGCTYEGFTKKESEQAYGVRHLQGMIGNPHQADFRSMVCSGMLDCNYTINNCENANLLLGKSLPTTIGGSVRKKPKHVDPEYVDIPMEIIDKNIFVTLNT